MHQYFELTFPQYEYALPEFADILDEMPLDSTCGDSCRQIINATWSWHNMIDAPGHGDYLESTLDAMLELTVSTCVVYIRG